MRKILLNFLSLLFTIKEFSNGFNIIIKNVFGTCMLHSNKIDFMKAILRNKMKRQARTRLTAVMPLQKLCYWGIPGIPLYKIL